MASASLEPVRSSREGLLTRDARRNAVSPEGTQVVEEIMTEFKLEGTEYIELNDLLKVTGLFASGGMAKTAIAEGRIVVNGQVELRRRCKIRTGQVVGYDGRTINVT